MTLEETWSDEALDTFLEDHKKVSEDGFTTYPTEAWAEKVKRTLLSGNKE